MAVVFVDFDETIFTGDYDSPPTEDCLFVLNKLRSNGDEINIYSFRTNAKEHDEWVESTIEMIKYLDTFKVPYDHVVSNKPYYDLIIDDRAIGVPLKNNCVDWNILRKMLNY